ncbi:MAG: flippase [Candidatus Magasanikbacteria bacterium]|nr:flippase [Candidatus Magasanikbacteria bacterium]
MIDILFLKLNNIVPEKWKWVLEHVGFKKYFKNTSWMFFGQMFRMGIAFFMGAWIARYLGPKNYGILNYSFAFVGLFTFITTLGISNILSRDLVKYPEKRNKLMGTSFIIQTLGGLLAFVLVVISVVIFEQSIFNRILIILYASNFLWGAFGIISIFFQSTVQAEKNVKISMIGMFASLILKVLFIIFGLNLIWLILIFIFESLINVILSVVIYRKSGHFFVDWKFDMQYAKKLLSSGWMLMLAAAASYIFTRVDQVMVRNFLDESSVGLYASAVRLVEIWYFVPGIICSSLFPAIVNAYKNNKVQYYNRLKKLYILLAVSAILIAIPLTFFASFIINLLFGNAYQEAVGILKIYVWSGVGLFVLWGIQQHLLIGNRLSTIFYIYLVLMILNISLNFIFIPYFGLLGAAWATFISYSLGPFIALILFKNNLKKFTSF